MSEPDAKEANEPESKEPESAKPAAKEPESAKPEARDDWGDPRPALIPQPSFWPMGLAFGTTLLFWGFITSMVLILVGLAVVITSLTGWIGEMRHEAKHS